MVHALNSIHFLYSSTRLPTLITKTCDMYYSKKSMVFCDNIYSFYLEESDREGGGRGRDKEEGRGGGGEEMLRPEREMSTQNL